jgi:hypothetical protein
MKNAPRIFRSAARFCLAATRVLLLRYTRLKQCLDMVRIGRLAPEAATARQLQFRNCESVHSDQRSGTTAVRTRLGLENAVNVIRI